MTRDIRIERKRVILHVDIQQTNLTNGKTKSDRIGEREARQLNREMYRPRDIGMEREKERGKQKFREDLMD